MIFLILTVLQSTAIFAVMKLFARFKIDNWQAITVNYIIACLFGFIIYEGELTASMLMEKSWFIFAMILGMTFIFTFFIFALSSQKVGVALTSVASKMSVIIPVIAGIILLNEQVSILAITGIVLALIAFYLSLGGGANSSFPRKYVILPVILFIGNGINDTIMKYSEHHFIENSNELTLFLAVIFLTSLIMGSIISTARYAHKKRPVSYKTIIAGTILGLLNFGSTFYILKSMGVYESAVVFPIANAGIVSLSALTGYILFREKLNRMNWAGILLAILAILLIANA